MVGKTWKNDLEFSKASMDWHTASLPLFSLFHSFKHTSVHTHTHTPPGHTPTGTHTPHATHTWVSTHTHTYTHTQECSLSAFSGGKLAHCHVRRARVERATSKYGRCRDSARWIHFLATSRSALGLRMWRFASLLTPHQLTVKTNPTPSVRTWREGRWEPFFFILMLPVEGNELLSYTLNCQIFTASKSRAALMN